MLDTLANEADLANRLRVAGAHMNIMGGETPAAILHGDALNEIERLRSALATRDLAIANARDALDELWCHEASETGDPTDEAINEAVTTVREALSTATPAAAPHDAVGQEVPNGWIGVDLDGTLAEHYWPHNGPFEPSRIGDPVPAMLARVKNWIANGRDVRIFTARADGGTAAIAAGNPVGEHFRDVDAIVAQIQAWTLLHVGVAMPVTNRKDYSMRELWDDRAVRIVCNTGEPCCAHVGA